MIKNYIENANFEDTGFAYTLSLIHICSAKPCVFQIGIKIQQIGALGKEQELMLWIFTDLCKYLVSPFRLPSGAVSYTHLDVYKRQVMDFTPRRCPEMQPC